MNVRRSTRCLSFAFSFQTRRHVGITVGSSLIAIQHAPHEFVPSETAGRPFWSAGCISARGARETCTLLLEKFETLAECCMRFILFCRRIYGQGLQRYLNTHRLE